MDTKKIIVVGGLVLGLTLLFSTKAKANAQDQLITNYDTVWDYKREGGVWFTRKKSTPQGGWIDMNATLSASAYSLAISRLNTFLTNKTL